MAKLYFHYSTMNAGKSTLLLQASHNYQERGMNTYLITAQLDNRAGEGKVGSIIGIGAAADTFTGDDDLFAKIQAKLSVEKISCVLIDEAQFLTSQQVWQLAKAVDDLAVPIMCYGLRVDFLGNLFPGSASLLALARIFPAFTALSFLQFETIPPAASIIGINGCISQILFPHCITASTFPSAKCE